MSGQVTLLDDYTFADVPSGNEYGFNQDTSTWWKNFVGQGEQSAELKTLSGNGWVGYQLGTGDAGWSEQIYAIPNVNDGVMIEIGFANGPLTETGGYKLEDIVRTLEFN